MVKLDEKNFIIFLDIDGTLVNEFEKSNLFNIQTIRSNNENVVLCTGRNFKRAKEFLDNNNLNVDVICFNGGGVIFDNKKIILHTIAKNDVVEITNYLLKLKIPFILHEATKDYIFSCFDFSLVARRMASMENYVNSYMLEKTVDAYNDFFENSCTILENLEETFNIISIECFPLADEQEKQVMSHMKKFIGYHMVNSYVNNIEILPLMTDKSIAAEWYLKKRKLKHYLSIAVGDSSNDVKVLKNVEKGYLVRNSNINVVGVKKLRSSNKDFFLKEVLDDTNLRKLLY